MCRLPLVVVELVVGCESPTATLLCTLERLFGVVCRFVPLEFIGRFTAIVEILSVVVRLEDSDAAGIAFGILGLYGGTCRVKRLISKLSQLP